MNFLHDCTVAQDGLLMELDKAAFCRRVLCGSSRVAIKFEKGFWGS